METFFAEIPGYDGYRAGSDGSIWSCWIERHGIKGQWRRLKTRIDDKGYERVSFGARGRRRSVPVHQLILLAFRGPRPNGMESLHRNHVRSDNRLDNLRYGTHAENIADKVACGGGRGIRTTRKLAPEQVLLVKWHALHGVRQKVTMAMIGVSQRMVSLIATGEANQDRTWLLDGDDFIKWMLDQWKPHQSGQGSPTCQPPAGSDSSAASGTTASKT